MSTRTNSFQDIMDDIVDAFADADLQCELTETSEHGSRGDQFATIDGGHFRLRVWSDDGQINMAMQDAPGFAEAYRVSFTNATRCVIAHCATGMALDYSF